ncbi:hypothetical protein KSC_046690 [Ktedonobacter sp. SOSP1-52]|uniref:phospholipase D-like domain-containing protein n=1 Tax=Ktedonobacter sp. SOSP1-52 TaxID=2778366 RepID=UPI001916C2BA|nr:phospholipase D-like domain-containing protein [Ktedonobacter sp. SOSP1-52]GHO65777.1 hypothetical protein KSC_046690 [Ktedonobacter sp. SOSP1-52]
MKPITKLTHWSILIPLLLTLALLLAACNVNGGDLTGTSSNTSNGSPTSLGTGSQNVQVFVEPDAGYQVITDAINQAQKSVWVEMYLLTERHVISALEEAAYNGKDVRVMLEGHPYGSGSSSPSQTIDRLNAAGVQAKTTNPAFALTHEKGMILDGKTAYILTANLTLSALGGSSSTTNREYGIIDTNAQDVQGAIDIFNADWDRKDVQVNGSNLVVSPINSRGVFLSLINGAQKSLIVEAEEMQDQQVEQALINAVKHGVAVQVVLPQPQSGSDSNQQGLDTITNGGVKVRESSKLYMHAKMMVVDGQKAFVGSENISTASFERNRELGVIIADGNVINTLQQTFQQDWSDSQGS